MQKNRFHSQLSRTGVHPNTLRKWASIGQIKYIRTPAGQRLYDVDNFLSNAKGRSKIVYCRTCYFIFCGHHSMHEVGHNIKICGGEYNLGDMTSLIPPEILPQSVARSILDTVEQNYHTRPRRHSI